MSRFFYRLGTIAFTVLFPLPVFAAGDAALSQAVDKDYASLYALYVDIHQNPELHDQEVETSARMAKEMQAAGLTVKTGIGGHGVVGSLKNGEGPVLLLRTIMDALPIAEQTGLEYASTKTAVAADGGEVPVAHVCGHDAMMVSAIGAVRYLAANRDTWAGTLILLAQPADETILGARTMIADGLTKHVPRPDFLIGYHLLPEFASNEVAWRSGDALAGAETAEIVVRGIPGHGSFPADAKDPIPLAAQIVLALQTLVTREIPPLETASLNIGYIQGGHEVNAIPSEVRLGATVRFYSDAVREKLVTGIPRIVEHQARAYGIPEDRMPTVSFLPSGSRATYNDPELTATVKQGFIRALGAEHVIESDRLLGTDETAELAHAWGPPVPMLFFYYGSSAGAALAAAEADGPSLPSLHAPDFAPDIEPTLRTGTKAIVGAVQAVLPR